MGDITEGLKALVVSAIASLVLIILGVIYFGITLWIIKAASNTFFGAGLEANWAVLSASLLATGAVLAGALEKKEFKGKR
ncbi:MAG: hypothetical protein QXF56_05580 [Candidatus Micrarchaeia archaeon]